jgi:Spy/CpxP family protein refolding chaperone
METAKRKSEAGILVLVVFILGVLVGGVGTHLWGARIWANGNGPERAGRPPQQGPTLAQKLQLSPDQQKQLDAIFTDSRTQLQANDAQHNAIRMQTRDKIRAILTPDQLAKFNGMIKDMDSHPRGPNRGGPPPGAGPGGPHPGPGF